MDTMSGSDTAKNGFRAEELFRTRKDINSALTNILKNQ
jgi:hypothetical protein